MGTYSRRQLIEIRSALGNLLEILQNLLQQQDNSHEADVWDAKTRFWTAQLVFNYLKDQGLEGIGEVLSQRIMNGTINISLDSVGSIHSFFQALLDPDNIAKLSGGASVVNQILVTIAVAGVNINGSSVDRVVQEYAQLIYESYRSENDNSFFSFFGSANRTDCTNTASFGINIGRGIPQEAEQSLRENVSITDIWRAGYSGFTGVPNFVNNIDDYVNRLGIGVMVTVRAVNAGDDIFLDTQVGDQIVWGNEHNATIVGYAVGDRYFFTFSDAKSQADASGEAIVSLIADNQDNNVRPYTDVLADSQYDDDEVNEPISNIIIIRDSP